MRTYAFPNAWALARRRLELLEATYDPASFRRAAALGIGPGWECLDAGAGHGSFARWLAARVGDRGSVLAADVDTRLLEELDDPGIEVHQMDLVTGELPRAHFDFVHTRLLLMHLRERDELLRKLVAALRPGGLLMVEEGDLYPVLVNANEDYLRAWKAFLSVTGPAGVDPTWARTLPQRLDALGLVDVDAEVDTQLFRGGDAPAQFWSLTWLQTRDEVSDKTGLDRGRTILDDPSRWFLGPATVIAWGRRASTAPR
jgi:SAM-dependent methyltransferase